MIRNPCHNGNVASFPKPELTQLVGLEDDVPSGRHHAHFFVCFTSGQQLGRIP
jgi:hypothetical protein